MMLEYVNIDEKAIRKLENCDLDDLIVAAHMVMYGIRNNIIQRQDGLDQLNNILIAMVED
jgi:hypothetical protein